MIYFKKQEIKDKFIKIYNGNSVEEYIDTCNKLHLQYGLLYDTEKYGYIADKNGYCKLDFNYGYVVDGDGEWDKFLGDDWSASELEEMIIEKSEKLKYGEELDVLCLGEPIIC